MSDHVNILATVEELARATETLREHARTMQAMIRAAEWCHHAWVDTPACPWCQGIPPSVEPLGDWPEQRGHQPGCQWVTAMAFDIE